MALDQEEYDDHDEIGPVMNDYGHDCSRFDEPGNRSPEAFQKKQERICFFLVKRIFAPDFQAFLNLALRQTVFVAVQNRQYFIDRLFVCGFRVDNSIHIFVFF